MAKYLWRLVESDTRQTLAENLEVADGFFSRMTGLLGRDKPQRGYGMLLVPCRSIHTFFMGFAIDVLLLSSEGQVLAVHRDVGPWRMIQGATHIHAVLEMPAGSANIVAGARLELEAKGGHSQSPPPSVQFLSPKN